MATGHGVPLIVFFLHPICRTLVLRKMEGRMNQSFGCIQVTRKPEFIPVIAPNEVTTFRQLFTVHLCVKP